MQVLCKTVDGHVEQCTVLRLTEDDIALARESWGIEFRHRFALGMRDPDEMIWSTGFLLATDGSPLNGYVITANNDIQGVIVVDKELRASRVHPSAKVSYVSYLATAPWNRDFGSRFGRYRGIGQVLVRQAIAEAVTLGTLGRVGLHSIAPACSFFEHLGFRNLGSDRAQRGMVYFEGGSVVDSQDS